MVHRKVSKQTVQRRRRRRASWEANRLMPTSRRRLQAAPGPVPASNATVRCIWLEGISAGNHPANGNLSGAGGHNITIGTTDGGRSVIAGLALSPSSDE